MNGLIKTANSTVAQLEEHKTEDLRRTFCPGFESKEFCKVNVLIFAK